MTTEERNYEVKKLCELSIRNRDKYRHPEIIGTMYAQEQKKRTLLLFLNVKKLGVVVYRI